MFLKDLRFNCLLTTDRLRQKFDAWRSSGYVSRLMYRGHGIESKRHIFDGHFSHLFAVKNLLFIRKYRGLGWPKSYYFGAYYSRSSHLLIWFKCSDSSKIWMIFAVKSMLNLQLLFGLFLTKGCWWFTDFSLLQMRSFTTFEALPFVSCWYNHQLVWMIWFSFSFAWHYPI